MRRALPTALAAILLLTTAVGAARAGDGADADDVQTQPPPASPPPATLPPGGRLLTPQQEGRQGVVRGVAEQPLRDFNLVRSKIPPVLADAMADAYARPPEGCDAIVAEVQRIDEAIGPDLDHPVSTDDPGMMARGKNAARNASLDAMRAGVQSYIPFDGYIRLVTGANHHDHLVMSAIQAGAVRRAYLKGLGEARGCSSPAVPLHLAHPVSVADSDAGG